MKIRYSDQMNKWQDCVKQDQSVLAFRKTLLETKECLLRRVRRTYLQESDRIGVTNIKSALCFVDNKAMGDMLNPDLKRAKAALDAEDEEYTKAVTDWRAVEHFCNTYFAVYELNNDMPMDQLEPMLRTLHNEASEEIVVSSEELERLKKAAEAAIKQTGCPKRQ